MAAEFMSVSLSVEENGVRAPDWSIEADYSGEWTLERLLQFTKANLIFIADYALKEEQDKGFDKSPMVEVDGSLTKPVINVSPLGQIVFTARQEALTVLKDTYKAIDNLSRVDTGQYKKSNWLFMNGQMIAQSFEEFDAWSKTSPNIRPKDIFRFVNVMPYARKLERYGVTSKRVLSRVAKSRDKQKRSGEFVLTPNGTYFLAFRSASRKYKTNVFMRFEFMPGDQLGINGVPAYSKSGKPLRRTYSAHGKWARKGKEGGSYLYPTIKITIGMGTL